MAEKAVWTVTVPGIDKGTADALAVKYWTSQGFEKCSFSCNGLVLRRNGYGTFGALFLAIIGYNRRLIDCPIQLEICTKILSDETEYRLVFRMGTGHYEGKKGHWQGFTKSQVSQFISHVHRRIAHVRASPSS